MPIASRTPEGWPNHCPVCRSEWRIEPSQPAGDAPCPVCGQLVWFDTENVRQRIEAVVSRNLGITSGALKRQPHFWRFDDSMDFIELIMDLEEEFGTSISPDEAFIPKTVEDLIEYILRRMEKNEEGN